MKSKSFNLAKSAGRPVTLGRIMTVCGLSIAAYATPHYAAADYAFANVGVQYLDWTDKTVSKTSHSGLGKKKSFPYMEFEGGAGGSWGDIYGFIDFENPGKDPNNAADPARDSRTAFKVVGRLKMTEVSGLPVMLYGRFYNFNDNGFTDQDRMIGLGTDVSAGKLSIKPFVAFRNEYKTNVSGKANGGMIGFTASYPLQVMDKNVRLSWWHDTEFGRKDPFLVMADGNGTRVTGSSVGHNGGIGAFYNINKQMTAGISYRYAYNKLGTVGLSDGLIYSLKYNF